MSPPVNLATDLRHELTLLVLSRYPLVTLESPDEGKVEQLVGQVAQDLSLPLMLWSSTGGLARAGGGRLADTRDPDRALARLLGMSGEMLALFRDLHPYFDRPEVSRRLREIERAFGHSRSTLVVSGVRVPLPKDLAGAAVTLELAMPGTEELEALVRSTARELSEQRRTRVDLSPTDVGRLARALKGLRLEDARRLLYRAALTDGCLSLDDLQAILEGKRRRLRARGILEWVEAVSGMKELGGAENLKRWAELRKEAHSEAAQRFGLEAPRGVLLVGVPGTGKSLACRALAGEWGQPLLRLDPGRLYDKYVGETEANLRSALATAEAMAPSVLWIDEIEKALASGRGAADDGLSQRILGTLLTWMQERPQPVFLAATSNDVQRLPVELLRRGRFDEVFFVDLPEPAERERIFAIHLQRRGRDPGDFDLERLAEASKGFSGAEIEGVVVAALYHAFSQRRALHDEVLLAEIAGTRPLSVIRPQEIAALRAWGREHAVPA